MSRRNQMILPANICSCRIMDVPPVGPSETDQIVRHRLSAFYPGSIEDLYIDSVRAEEKAVVFFSPKNKIDTLRNEKGTVSLYSSWHLLSSLKEKEGKYAVALADKIDILEYKNDQIVSVRSRENSFFVRDELSVNGCEIIEGDGKTIQGRFPPLFEGKKRKSYLLPNIFLFVLIIALPQLAYWRQVVMDEEHVAQLRNEIIRLTAESVKASSSEEELEKLILQYDALFSARPLNVMGFLSDLSIALGRDVTINNLVLKDKSFQLNGEGYNPLGKMENFQENQRFGNVLPYQVKAIEGSGRESFSLTGKYDYE